ncbi:MAG: hypothetical protein JXL67_14345 [Calditrichaeota bacterium]|nr:hypothetical protein [Calditrichota bacterium]
MKRDQSLHISWERYRETEQFLLKSLQSYKTDFPEVLNFEKILYQETSTRFNDWIDHLVFRAGDLFNRTIEELGFIRQDIVGESDELVYHHPGSIFPPILIVQDKNPSTELLFSVSLMVENLPVFLSKFGLPGEIEGSPLSPYRRARAWKRDGRELWVSERQGTAGFLPEEMPGDFAHQVLAAHQVWLTRKRSFESRKKGIDFAIKKAEALVSQLGQDLAAWVAFRAERDYWQIRNRAGQIQKRRQDVYGLGWANHDHHTFRSSRESFIDLLHLLSVFGFQRREKFYAGAEAGWGAQVLEQPVCGLVVFADVDLSPHELEMDFMTEKLSSRADKGTVGLWCALHGESVLEAGLHHLACRFSFTRAQNDLEKEGVYMLPPFSNLPFLKQAFTQGEKWMVKKETLRKLKENGQLSDSQLTSFTQEGVIGSHMENIQRDEGFKGFNQESVSDIIRRTDPRYDFGAA